MYMQHVRYVLVRDQGICSYLFSFGRHFIVCMSLTLSEFENVLGAKL